MVGLRILPRSTLVELIEFGLRRFPFGREEGTSVYSTTTIVSMEYIAEAVTGKSMKELLETEWHRSASTEFAIEICFEELGVDESVPSGNSTVEVGHSQDENERPIGSTRTGGGMYTKITELLQWAKSECAINLWPYLL
eukprot:scaffold538_cov166-Amphora_coffeaeformis.AAC.1